MLRISIARLLVIAGIAAIAVAAGAQSGLLPKATQNNVLDEMLKQNSLARVFRVGNDVSRIYGNVPMLANNNEDSARAFVAQYAEAFGVLATDLQLQKSAPIDNRFEVFWFAQTSRGIRVEGSGLTVLIRPGIPNAVVLASPHIRPVPENEPNGLISGVQAQAVVRNAMPKAQYIDSPEFMIWSYSEYGHYAYMVRAGTFNKVTPQRFMFFVDASTGQILEKRDEVYHVDVTGSVMGYMTPGHNPDEPTNPPVQGTIFDMLVNISGGNRAYTDASGNFTIANTGSTDVTVNAQLRGHWANVLNNAGSNEVRSMVVTPPGPANFLMNPTPTELVTAQVNGFVNTEIVHNFAKSINPAYPGIDVMMPVNVNLNQTCNAYYTGGTINFFRSGGGCNNSAYANVIYHEYGHFIIASGHNNPTGDYHEGEADVNASLLQDDNIIGRHFYTSGAFIRDVDTPNVLYPCSGEVHQCGLVVAGAFWDMLRELRLTMGNGPGMTLARYLHINSILLSPAVDPGLTIDVLTLDDNDGNLANGSPHYFEIDRGFRQHNLAAPPLQFLGFRIAPSNNAFLPANQTIGFIVQPYAIVNLYAPNTTHIHYRINGGAWVDNAVPDLFNTSRGSRTPNATIPAQPVGTLIEWYFSAMDTSGNTVNDVDPLTPHESIAATTVITVLNDNFETNQGWAVVNDPSLTTGAWQRGVPVTATRGEPPAAQGGSGQCYVTDNRSGDFDVDGGPTVLTSPVFDMAGSNGIVSIYYWMYCSTGEDQLVLQVSNDGGTSWTSVRSWTGSSSAWKRFSFVVSKYIAPTGNMKIRLSVSDNPNNSVTEAGLDTVLIRKAN